MDTAYGSLVWAQTDPTTQTLGILVSTETLMEYVPEGTTEEQLASSRFFLNLMVEQPEYLFLPAASIVRLFDAEQEDKEKLSLPEVVLALHNLNLVSETAADAPAAVAGGDEEQEDDEDAKERRRLRKEEKRLRKEEKQRQKEEKKREKKRRREEEEDTSSEEEEDEAEAGARKTKSKKASTRNAEEDADAAAPSGLDAYLTEEHYSGAGTARAAGGSTRYARGGRYHASVAAGGASTAVMAAIASIPAEYSHQVDRLRTFYQSKQTEATETGKLLRCHEADFLNEAVQLLRNNSSVLAYVQPMLKSQAASLSAESVSMLKAKIRSLKDYDPIPELAARSWLVDRPVKTSLAAHLRATGVVSLGRGPSVLDGLSTTDVLAGLAANNNTESTTAFAPIPVRPRMPNLTSLDPSMITYEESANHVQLQTTVNDRLLQQLQNEKNFLANTTGTTSLQKMGLSNAGSKVMKKWFVGRDAVIVHKGIDIQPVPATGALARRYSEFDARVDHKALTKINRSTWMAEDTKKSRVVALSRPSALGGAGSFSGAFGATQQSGGPLALGTDVDSIPAYFRLYDFGAPSQESALRRAEANMYEGTDSSSHDAAEGVHHAEDHGADHELANQPSEGLNLPFDPVVTFAGSENLAETLSAARTTLDRHLIDARRGASQDFAHSNSLPMPSGGSMWAGSGLMSSALSSAAASEEYRSSREPSESREEGGGFRRPDRLPARNSTASSSSAEAKRESESKDSRGPRWYDEAVSFIRGWLTKYVKGTSTKPACIDAVTEFSGAVKHCVKACMRDKEEQDCVNLSLRSHECLPFTQNDRDRIVRAVDKYVATNFAKNRSVSRT